MILFAVDIHVIRKGPIRKKTRTAKLAHRYFEARDDGYVQFIEERIGV
jgi:hypothetical protein